MGMQHLRCHGTTDRYRRGDPCGRSHVIARPFMAVAISWQFVPVDTSLRLPRRLRLLAMTSVFLTLRALPRQCVGDGPRTSLKKHHAPAGCSLRGRFLLTLYQIRIIIRIDNSIHYGRNRKPIGSRRELQLPTACAGGTSPTQQDYLYPTFIIHALSVFRKRVNKDV